LALNDEDWEIDYNLEKSNHDVYKGVPKYLKSRSKASKLASFNSPV
jgi:hypothetical protein